MQNEFFDNIQKKTGYVDGPAYLVTKRHWGSALTLDANTRVNFIHDEPSAHFHTHRTEDYILYEGEMEVYRGTLYPDDLEKTVANLKPTRLVPGDRVVIEPYTIHIPINLSPKGSTFIEISHGPYEDNDIKRVYDKSGRDLELAKKWSELGYKANIGIKELITETRKNLT